jgi:nucleotide-binding universal stress UspA family protein
MSVILVAFDDTPATDDALAFATELARETGASIRIACEGSPPHGLQAAAERWGAALIVVGSTRRGPLGRLLHDTSCPIAVVPPGYANDPKPIETIVVGYDASAEAASALAGACLLARRLDAALRVVHVFDAGSVGRPALLTGPAWLSMRDEHGPAQRRELEEAAATVPPDVRCEPRFLTGSPGRELARESEAADLVVVGSRGHGPLAAAVLGGVTRRLLRSATVPVIVLPRGAGVGLDALFAPDRRPAASSVSPRRDAELFVPLL